MYASLLLQVLQMRPHADGASAQAFEYYVLKTYYKTGSLMANSCRAAALLGESLQSHTVDMLHDYVFPHHSVIS